MPKYALGLIVLAFVVGAGVGAIMMTRGGGNEEPVDIAQMQIDQPQAKPEQKKEDNREEKDKPDDLDGDYGDPSSCAALYQAQTYEKNEDFMFMLPGKGSWVFRTRQDLQMAFDLPQEDLAVYQSFVSALRSKGTELVMAYIPTRGMIAEQMLPDDAEQTEDYDAASARENYNALIAKMQDAGVNFVGTPTSSVGAAYFNHADQHWSTQGAREMARAVAAFVKGKPVASQLPRQSFKTTIGEEMSYDGRFGEFIKKACGFRPQPEKDNLVKTERVADGDDEATALLGEQSAPVVVLVGTSNSIRDEFNSNFEGFLKEALSTDVYNAAISGGGMDDSILAYLASDRYRKSPPKLLIWELPGYYDMGGAGMEFTLRQAVAAAAGYCDNPLARFEKAKVEGKKVPLFAELSGQNIAADQAYIAIKFEEPLSKDFSISIKTEDGKNQKFKFKKRREGNGDAFFYWPKGGEAMLSAVTLNVNKHIDGRVVEARLCPMMPPQSPSEASP